MLTMAAKQGEITPSREHPTSHRKNFWSCKCFTQLVWQYLHAGLIWTPILQQPNGQDLQNGYDPTKKLNLISSLCGNIEYLHHQSAETCYCHKTKKKWFLVTLLASSRSTIENYVQMMTASFRRRMEHIIASNVMLVDIIIYSTS